MSSKQLSLFGEPKQRPVAILDGDHVRRYVRQTRGKDVSDVPFSEVVRAVAEMKTGKIDHSHDSNTIGESPRK